MRRFTFTAILLAAFLASASMASAQVSIGIRIGPPPAPRVVRVAPRRPGPDYIFVQGYWYPVGNHYKWHNGYWTRAPYPGARWVAPRYEGRQYFNGYWEGDRGRLEHDHRSDRNRNRDYRNDRDDRRNDRRDDRR
jgi:hypothetical protein